MSSEYPSPAKSRDQSPWRVFKGRGPWAEAAQAAGFRARPRVSRAAATLPFRDGLPFPAGVHSIYPRLLAGTGVPYGWRQVYGAKDNEGQCTDLLGYAFSSICGQDTPTYMRASSKVFRMKSMGPAGSATLYAGIGPVDKQVYDCKALNSLPKQLYRPSQSCPVESVEWGLNSGAAPSFVSP